MSRMEGISKLALFNKDAYGFEYAFKHLGVNTRRDMRDVCRLRQEANAQCAQCNYFAFCEGRLKNKMYKEAYYARKIKERYQEQQRIKSELQKDRRQDRNGR